MTRKAEIAGPYRTVRFTMIVATVLMLVIGSGSSLVRASSSTDVAASATSAQDGSSDPGTLSVPDLVEQVMPSVVTVYAANASTLGAGTGFSYDEDGHIVTNWHVVTGMDQYIVVLNDDTALPATLVGIDPRDDVAVLEIDKRKAPDPVPVGDDTKLRLGDPVVAIGTPTGFLPGTVSTGVVSGLGRDQLASTDSSCQAYADMIQHDAAISQGNSGGPLFNARGEVIGINTTGIPVNDAGVPNQNLNFAVPSSRIEEMADQIIKDGHVSIPLFGVKTKPNLPSSKSDFEQENLFQIGAEITQVANNSPADDAGLKKDDVIVAIDGNVFTVESGLTSQLVNYNPGDTIKVTYYRGNRARTANVELVETPERILNLCKLDGGSQPQE